METEQPVPLSAASLVEDALQNHETRFSDLNLASRLAEEASSRRYDAAAWLRKMVGVVGGKDLPAQPSEEEFRVGLRSGLILCNVLNKVKPGAVPKVVEVPFDPLANPDGASLSAYQYFENVRNFLVAVEGMGLPTFEPSDLERGGISARIVNCVLALKSYHEWKQEGANGTWRIGGNVKSITNGKHLIREHSEPFTRYILKALTANCVGSLSNEQSLCSDLAEDLDGGVTINSLNTLVRAVLSNKSQEEIPTAVASMLSRVIEEFEHRLASQCELAGMKKKSKDMSNFAKTESSAEISSLNMQTEETDSNKEEESDSKNHICEEGSNSAKDVFDEEPISQLRKPELIVEQQQKDIKELKQTFYMTREGMQFFQNKYLQELNNLGERLHGLSQAASSYRRVLEENRKLYNTVMDLKGNIRVYCRVRPFLNGQPTRVSSVSNIEEGSITVITPSKYGKDGHKLFNFNRVFGPFATQAEVFSDTQPLIRSVLDGYNVCIFAYGQTGSGKTYTMTGPEELTDEGLGVNYRALSDLFFLSEQRKDTILYEVSVQMMEIYNEQVRDLLVADGGNKKVEIRNSSQNGINVPDANRIPVSSTSDVINLMNLGHKNRAVSSTAMNDRSSRSHSCLMVHVQGKDLTSGNILRGCMHLVDLAGSERVDKSEVIGERLKEAQHINKSLSALGDVISSLSQKSTHVPYRNSKLTQLLQDSLGGQAKTLMFVHISPEPEAIGETLSTLKFAERVSTVELGAAQVNRDNSEMKELKEQIATLKAALAKKEGDTEKRSHSRPSSPARGNMKRAGSHHSLLSQKSVGDISGSHRQPLDDHTKIESRNGATSKPRRRSLDPKELSMKSTKSLASSPIMSPQESGPGDWIDKLMVNRDEGLRCNWSEDNRQLSDLQFLRDPVCQANLRDDMQRTQCEMTNADDSEEVDAATSDSSEPDLLWQLNLPKTTGNPNVLGSKAKKTNPKSIRGPESRIPSLIPSIRKQPNGTNQSLQRPGRLPASSDVKRRSGLGK